ncbi:MAG TPA: hypothetical protein PLT00_11875 [Verrucomicrobiota bacterium]|jgi:hypothetical protein|nr:hypothetical protein [Verrucomicrobiota bacterium]HPY30988.1 hypothetical protein [Verrucomicrobiota bacterium]HQB17399.1 hypothetical protein [Verrucomicrobiota bacterium]
MKNMKSADLQKNAPCQTLPGWITPYDRSGKPRENWAFCDFLPDEIALHYGGTPR